MPIKRLLIDGDYPLHQCAFSAEKKMCFVVREDNHSVIDQTPLRDAKKDYAQEVARGEVYFDEYLVIDPEESYINHLEDEIAFYKAAIPEATSSIIVVAPEGKLARHDVFPEYKAGRASKPHHLQAGRRHLFATTGAIFFDKLEADDVLGIIQCSSLRAADEPETATTCIVSIDKDLKCIPGWNYNVKSKELTWVSREEADRHFATQWLVGDTTDNIRGIDGVGPKTAAKILDKNKDWVQAVYDAYWEDELKQQGLKHKDLKGKVLKEFSKEVEKRLLMVGELIWIRRSTDSFTDTFGADISGRTYAE